MKKLVIYIICFLISCAYNKAQALELHKANEQVDVMIFSNFDEVNPNQKLEFLIRFKMKNGWHIFAQNPGEIGMPTQVNWTLPQGFMILEESWSRDSKFINQGITQYGYGDIAYYKTTIRPHQNSKSVPIKLKIRWLACQEDCVPGLAMFDFELPMSQQILQETEIWNSELAAAKRWFLMDTGQKIYWGAVLVLAFLGGLILNFMPCILPILTLKALTLIHSSYDKRKNRMEALCYTIGVLVSFLIVATILLLLRLNGEYVGWGFQLQSPIFVSIMIGIFILISLMLLDIITFNNPLANTAGHMSFQNHLISSFMTGFLAVLIASPCTAPFMGIAIGYTLTAPLMAYYPVFLALALGYALPFALINLYPKPLQKILPKPGKWMVILKRLFAIPVVLTCVWLAWVLYAQVNKKTMENNNLNWQVYSEEAVQQNINNGEAVFINFTAKWCLTCLLNKRTSLDTDSFEDLVKKNNINLYVADWTNNDEIITQALEEYGRNSIPLYVYYDGKSDDYLLLPQLLTPAIMEEYLK